jgi:hypothetical protein
MNEQMDKTICGGIKTVLKHFQENVLIFFFLKECISALMLVRKRSNNGFH